ncbi:hypothetical protein BCR32DRAFT_243115 [Anaeromyces robustus]|uniref:DNA polymerase delta/zeta catalytic subunit N-terminal domain-containing protein n=1 Tax=Anaeromyces robustus TaxID=1754192 RepID=A0A1Y1XED3_9FUNG|nr:hypothetical protein BCR32DRAFT_243115 [Anaeromyces robustus]|eukprot:ORX83806.1 hypothetical protein BCR32DRAFT_243115 [Anaeromyces robustus]
MCKIINIFNKVYPYLYIKYTGSLDPDKGIIMNINVSKFTEYMNKLFHSINNVLRMTDSQFKNNHYIYNIELIKGIPFYGFSPNYEHFLKISLYPFYINFLFLLNNKIITDI